MPTRKGNIVNIETNEVVGEHIGLMYYTIGQRRGVDLGGNKERMFVVGKDLNQNILYVALGEQNKYLYSDEALIESVNFISSKRPTTCTTKFRYRQSDNNVLIEYIDDTHIKVKYPQMVKAVTPGQACVLYLEEECLGGGIIQEVHKNGKKLWYL